jgi:ATP-dependent Clp protease protease subunit
MDRAMIPAPLERKLFFTSQVDQATIADLSKKIVLINKDDDDLEKVYGNGGLSYPRPPIQIYIDSYGGYVYQCLGLLSLINTSKTPIHTILTGAAMSCGFLMLIHGHKRFAHELSTGMYHQVSSGAWGKIKDMEEDVEESKRLQNILMQLTVKKTKISLETLKDNYERKRDWFMDARTMIDNGVVDEIML